MINVSSLCETFTVLPPNVVTLAANTAADVLLSRRGSGTQYSYRFLQNLTGADLYIAYDATADNVANYHAVIGSGQQLSVPCNSRVSCFSVAGGKVATAEFRREA